MSDRYKSLFKLEEGVYSCGSPIIINAGALLNDTQNEKILVQLKLTNINNKCVHAVKVLIKGVDSFDNPALEIDFSYIDLHIKRNEQFGQQTPIYIDNNNIRSFSVSVIEVVFDDGTKYNYSNDTAIEHISKPTFIRDYLKSNDLSEEYKYATTEKCLYVVKDYSDIWMCSCGAYNHKNEDSCYYCKQNKRDLIKLLDIEELKTIKTNHFYDNKLKEAISLSNDNSIQNIEKAIKIFEEIKEWKDTKSYIDLCNTKIKAIQTRNSKRIKLVKKAAIAICTLIVITISAIIANTYYFKPNSIYKKAMELIENQDYDNAYLELDKIGTFKKANEVILQSKYDRAISLIESKEYTQAYSLLLEIGSFNSADEVILKNKFERANEHLENKEFDEAYALLSEVGQYNDADVLILHNKYERAMDFLDSKRFDEAYQLLSEVGQYNNADTVILQSKYDRSMALIDSEQYEEAYQLLSEVGKYNNADTFILQNKYDRAMDYIEIQDFNAGYSLLSEIGSYNDANSFILNSKYTRANEYEISGDVENAIELFSEIKNYKDSNERVNNLTYNLGIQSINKKSYELAKSYFESVSLNRYKDSAQYISFCNMLIEYEKINDGKTHELMTLYSLIDSVKDFKPCKDFCSEDPLISKLLSLNGIWSFVDGKFISLVGEWEYTTFTLYPIYEFDNGVVNEKKENGYVWGKMYLYINNNNIYLYAREDVSDIDENYYHKVCDYSGYGDNTLGIYYFCNDEPYDNISIDYYKRLE